jgi:predicted membrane GTPase involved in stress response
MEALGSRRGDLQDMQPDGKGRVQLTNIRAAGKDEAMLLTPPIRHTLESAVEFIADDELVEITPSASAQAPAAQARAQTRLPRRRAYLTAPRSPRRICVHG